MHGKKDLPKGTFLAIIKQASVHVLYIEELQERGETIPDDSNTLEYSINIPV